LEELYNKKWVQGHKLIIPVFGFWCDILLVVDGWCITPWRLLKVNLPCVAAG
jgi:hypothetical protein